MMRNNEVVDLGGATSVLDTAAESNRRAAFRVDDTIDLSVRTLEPAEFTRLAGELRRRHENEGHGGPDAPRRPSPLSLQTLERIQPEVHAWIMHLEASLADLQGESRATASAVGSVVAGSEQGVLVDLSETGIGFPLVESLETGTLVSVELGLSTLDRPLELVAEIVACRGSTDTSTVTGSAQFRDLDPADREALVRHIFAVQREQLRQRRAD